MISRRTLFVSYPPPLGPCAKGGCEPEVPTKEGGEDYPGGEPQEASQVQDGVFVCPRLQSGSQAFAGRLAKALRPHDMHNEDIGEYYGWRVRTTRNVDTCQLTVGKMQGFFYACYQFLTATRPSNWAHLTAKKVNVFLMLTTARNLMCNHFAAAFYALDLLELALLLIGWPKRVIIVE